MGFLIQIDHLILARWDLVLINRKNNLPSSERQPADAGLKNL